MFKTRKSFSCVCRVEMTHRKGCPRVQMKGIFVGAKVVRGPDWDWSNQDGGEGKKIFLNAFGAYCIMFQVYFIFYTQLLKETKLLTLIH